MTMLRIKAVAKKSVAFRFVVLIGILACCDYSMGEELSRWIYKDFTGIQLSGDGKRFLVSAKDKAFRKIIEYSIDENESRLLSSEGVNYSAVYSPDSKKIAYISMIGKLNAFGQEFATKDTSLLKVIDSDTGKELISINLSSSILNNLDWSPDSENLLFQVDGKNGRNKVAKLNLPTEKIDLVYDGEGDSVCPTYSLDAEAVLYFNAPFFGRYSPIAERSWHHYEPRIINFQDGSMTVMNITKPIFVNPVFIRSADLRLGVFSSMNVSGTSYLFDLSSSKNLLEEDRVNSITELPDEMKIIGIADNPVRLLAERCDYSSAGSRIGVVSAKVGETDLEWHTLYETRGDGVRGIDSFDCNLDASVLVFSLESYVKNVDGIYVIVNNSLYRRIEKLF